MPYLDPFDNDRHMRQWMVMPQASDEDLASFLDPYIPVEIRRGERECIVFFYCDRPDISLFRRRADEWEKRQLAARRLPDGREK